MSFSGRDRLKVKAGLAELHALGHDTGEVTRLAKTLMGMGTPERNAYARAFDGFVARVPAMHAPLQRIGQLVDTYDSRSLARYDLALTNYITTGDQVHLDAIAPAVAHDMANMARQTGDAGFADALPERSLAGDRSGPGWQSGRGFSPADARARPDAPPPPGEATQRPGWGPLGYSPASAKAAPQIGLADT